MKQELDEYTPHPGSEESWDGVSPDTDQTLSGPINPAPKAAELPEDQVGKKRSIMDFVDDIENKAQNNKLVEPVKTYERDGKTIKIFGTEDDGYRVKVNDKDSAKTFGKLESAVRACETFLERLEERARLQNDYVDEK